MVENDKFPILIYDDLCYSCTKFAKMANTLCKQKITIIGHYSESGGKIKKNFFPKGYEGLEMFWFINKGFAFGGRSGLEELVNYILFDKKTGIYPKNIFKLAQCTTDCKTVKGVFIRSHSIITNSKKFKISA